MKYFNMILIILGTVLCYVLLLATQDTHILLVETANASGNWTGFESSQAVLVGWPLIIWFIPGLGGLVALVMVWKSRD